MRAEEIELSAPLALSPNPVAIVQNTRSGAGRQGIGSTDGPVWSNFGRLPIPVESAARERCQAERPMSGTEIIFEVSEDELDGGFSASALGCGIHTQGDTIDDLRRNVREAVDCYFDDDMARPRLIRLHYVRDEVLVA